MDIQRKRIRKYSWCYWRTNEEKDTNQDREIVSSLINNQLPYYRDVELTDQFTKQQVLLAEQRKKEARIALETLKDQLHFHLYKLYNYSMII